MLQILNNCYYTLIFNLYNVLYCLKLLVECNDEDSEDAWVNIEDMPHLVSQCYKLKKNGFVVQNEQNKYLFKLNV